MLYITNQNQNNKEQICIGGLGGEIELFEIQQQKQQINFKLVQTFPQEHSSSHSITSIIQLNPNTLIFCSASHSVMVIWAKSKSTSLYEPIQRITRKEAGGGFYRLVLLNQKKEEEEEEFASCSFDDDKTIVIWRRGKGDKFKIRQKITNVENVSELLYISFTNELISGSFDSPLLQIWSSSSSSNFKQRQKIQTPSYICSLCQINEINNDSSRRIEFASGHENGQIMIWSKQQQINESKYSLIRTLKPFDHYINDLVFINDNGFDFFSFLLL